MSEGPVYLEALWKKRIAAIARLVETAVPGAGALRDIRSEVEEARQRLAIVRPATNARYRQTINP